ncbi:ribosome recycling factor [Clostridium sp. 'deep sea']|uniref:ribosome recycling factor n=1 Tax=Clostridium sp. 'deep sea' TaxID=2779445 RepID=UPI0018967A75|nr:ribosome recycling factor [Clostridium sp. 'deep sea']QOR36029.1 ribosome recycling factor [Clostridium sp. 'deep sea']
MIKEVLADCESRMQKTIKVFEGDLKSVRAGRATPSLLDKITVEYYGSSVPIKQVGNVTAPEPRLLVIQPWDKTVIPLVEKAILQSDLGLNPNNDGTVIRLNIPQLTSERRQKLLKVIRKMAEECKIAVRNIRRDANDEVKMLENEKEITEDDSRRGLEQVQDLTNKYVKETDVVLKKKEEELLEV